MAEVERVAVKPLVQMHHAMPAGEEVKVRDKHKRPKEKMRQMVY